MVWGACTKPLNHQPNPKTLYRNMTSSIDSTLLSIYLCTNVFSTAYKTSVALKECVVFVYLHRIACILLCSFCLWRFIVSCLSFHDDGKKLLSFVTSNALQDLVACDLLMQNAKSLRHHIAVRREKCLLRENFKCCWILSIWFITPARSYFVCRQQFESVVSVCCAWASDWQCFSGCFYQDTLIRLK